MPTERDGPHDGPDWRPGWVPALVVLALFAAAAALHGFGGDAYYRLRAAVGLKPFVPFLDLHNVMAAIACWRDGIDVYATNPCDAMGRVHIYSPLWLRLPAFFGDPALLNPLGIACALAFIAALVPLPWPRARCCQAVMLMATVSPATGFALERANIDLLIYVLAVAGALLLARGLGARIAGYGVFLLAGLLKFYPLALGLLLLRERWRTGLALAAIAAAVLAVSVLPLHDEYRRAVASILPHPQFTDTFGAGQIAAGLALLFPGALWIAFLAIGALAGGGAVLSWRLAGDPALGDALAALPARHRNLLQVGGTLVVGCFLAGQNVEYRAVLLLPALPALLALAQSGHLVAGIAALAGAALMWDPLLRRVLMHLAPSHTGLPSPPVAALWLLREVGWWFVAAVLAGLVLSLLLRGRYSAPGWAASQSA